MYLFTLSGHWNISRILFPHCQGICNKLGARQGVTCQRSISPYGQLGKSPLILVSSSFHSRDDSVNLHDCSPFREYLFVKLCRENFHSLCLLMICEFFAFVGLSLKKMFLPYHIQALFSSLSIILQTVFTTFNNYAPHRRREGILLCTCRSVCLRTT